MQPADHRATHDGHHEAQAHVQERDLQAEQAGQHHESDLVDYRGGDQEGEGHPEWQAGLEKADEHGHGRARTERGDRAQQRRQDRARQLAFARHDLLDLLGRDVAADDADYGDDPGKQEEDLRHVGDEKIDGCTEVGVTAEVEQVISEPTGEPAELAVGADPQGDRDGDLKFSDRWRALFGPGKGSSLSGPAGSGTSPACAVASGFLAALM